MACPTHSQLRDWRYTMIPHQLRGVAAALSALDLEARPDMRVRVGHLVAYTRPVICVAAIHCRMMMRFLGLQREANASFGVIPRDKYRADEVWIGSYRALDGTPLEAVSRAMIARLNDAGQTESAWLTTCDFAAQGLALAMRDERLIEGTLTPSLRRTFGTLPAAIDEWFYARAALRANL